MRWLCHICKTTLAYNAAKLAISHGSLIFLGFKNNRGLCCLKKQQKKQKHDRRQVRCANEKLGYYARIRIYMNIQVSLCACKRCIPNVIETEIRLITWTQSMTFSRQTPKTFGQETSKFNRWFTPEADPLWSGCAASVDRLASSSYSYWHTGILTSEAPW